MSRNYEPQLEKHHFDSGKKGDHLVITARIHGNEPSGEIAARQIIADIHEKKISIERGKLTLFPLLNPLAKQVNKRGFERDMNRDIHKSIKAQTSPEHGLRHTIAREFQKIDKQVKREQLRWHVLDLHSVPMAGKPHVITSEGAHDLDFAKAFGLEKIYTDWRQAQLRADPEDIKATGMTMSAYRKYTAALVYAARDMGAYSAVCLESGQHDEPDSVQTAYEGIKSTLSYFGLTSDKVHKQNSKKEFKLTHYLQVFYRRDESEFLSKDIVQDAQILQPNQIIIEGKSRIVRAPADSKNTYIISHPIPEARVGEHMGILAKIEQG